MTRTFTPDHNELRKIAELPTELALRHATAFLADLVEDPDSVGVQFLPLIADAHDKDDCYVAHRCDGADDAFSLQVVVWPSGAGSMIHDHTSWGAFRCATGAVLEERYARLDDGARPEHARLKKDWQVWWNPQDGASTLLPGDGGIHRVGNPGESPAVSVHLYGPRVGAMDGRDYDTTRDYVCDRP